MSLGRAPRLTTRMLLSIRGNARVLLLFEPLFVVPFTMYNVYASLYMRELGLSAQEIGLLASVGTASFMLSSTAAGHIADRLGRRYTTLLFDLAAWSAVLLIWAGARNFWHFLLAAILNGLQAIPSTSWSCWLVEDYRQEERLSIFAALQMVTPLAALAAPLGGLVVRRLGVVPGARLLYLFAFACMTAMFLGRHLCTTESRVGEDRRRTTGTHTLRESLRDYGQALSLLAANRSAVVYFIITGVFWFRDSLIGPFSQLLLVDRLRMSEGLLAVFPAVGGAATLLTLLLALPLLVARERTGVASGLMLLAASTAVLIWSPAGSVALVILSNLLGAAGLAIFTPSLNTAWNNALGDGERAKVYAMAYVFWSLLKLPAGFTGGVLYHSSPVWPFAASLALLLLGLLLLRISARKMGDTGRPATG